MSANSNLFFHKLATHEQFEQFAQQQYHSDGDMNNEQAQQQGQDKKAMNYYAVLGIEKTASMNDIKAAFRKRSKELHPDRHADNLANSNAKRVSAYFELQQQELNTANEVLSDERKRTAYDFLGDHGVQLLALLEKDKKIDKNTTKQQVASKLRYYAQQEKLLKHHNKSNSESSAAMHFDWKKKSITQITIDQYFEMPLNKKNLLTFSLQSQLSSKQGVAKVNYYQPAYSTSIGYRRHHSKETFFHIQGAYAHNQQEASYLQSPGLVHIQTLVQTMVSKHMIAGFAWHTLLIPEYVAPKTGDYNPCNVIGFETFLTRVFSPSTSGVSHLAYVNGQPTVSATITSNVTPYFEHADDNKNASQVQFRATSAEKIALEASWRHAIGDFWGFRNGIKWKTPSFNKDQTGYSNNWTMEVDSSLTYQFRSLGYLYKLLFSYDTSVAKPIGNEPHHDVQIGIGAGSNGIRIKIGYSHVVANVPEFAIDLPIQVTEQYTWKSLFYTVAVPCLVYLAGSLVILPFRKRFGKQSLLRKRMNNYNATEKERLHAQKEAQGKEVQQKALESRTEEDDIGGLIIINATYGLSEEQRRREEQILGLENAAAYPSYLDVTNQLQSFVESSQLKDIKHNSKLFSASNAAINDEETFAKLRGFYDPCPKEEKYLHVIYQFKGRKHKVEVHDQDELRIPVQSDFDEELNQDGNEDDDE